MRYLVNVNITHSTIVVHSESKEKCSEIFKQITTDNTSSKKDIEQIGNNKSILKIGTTDNSFWLLIHENIDSTEENIKNILLNDLKLNNIFSFVSHC